MPAESKAQQKLLFAKEARGEVAPGTASEFAVSGEEYKKLPERKGKKAKKRTTKRKSRR